MKILFCNGFNEDELYNYKTILVQNLMLGIRDLINLAEEAKLPDVEANKKVSFFDLREILRQELTLHFLARQIL